MSGVQVARSLNAAELARLPPEEQERLRRNAEENAAEWRWHAGAPEREREAQAAVTRRAREHHDACLLAVEAALHALPRVATFVGQVGALPSGAKPLGGRGAPVLGALLADTGEDGVVWQSLLLERRRLLGDPLTATGGQGLFWAGVLVGLGALIDRTQALEGSLSDLAQEVTGLERVVAECALHEQVVPAAAGARADQPEVATVVATEDGAQGRQASEDTGVAVVVAEPKEPPKDTPALGANGTTEEGGRDPATGRFTRIRQRYGLENPSQPISAPSADHSPAATNDPSAHDQGLPAPEQEQQQEEEEAQR